MIILAENYKGEYIEMSVALTNFDKRVVCVFSEETVGEEGDDGVDGGHVQYSYTVIDQT